MAVPSKYQCVICCHHIIVPLLDVLHSMADSFMCLAARSLIPADRPCCALVTFRMLQKCSFARSPVCCGLLEQARGQTTAWGASPGAPEEAPHSTLMFLALRKLGAYDYMVDDVLGHHTQHDGEGEGAPQPKDIHEMGCPVIDFSNDHDTCRWHTVEP